VAVDWVREGREEPWAPGVRLALAAEMAAWLVAAMVGIAGARAVDPAA
jgi:hypothetical protein